MYDFLPDEVVYVRHPYTQQFCVGHVTAPPSLVTVRADSVYVCFQKSHLPSGRDPGWAGFVCRKIDCVRMRGNLEHARQQHAAPETTASPLEPTTEEPPSCTP